MADRLMEPVPVKGVETGREGSDTIYAKDSVFIDFGQGWIAEPSALWRRVRRTLPQGKIPQGIVSCSRATGPGLCAEKEARPPSAPTERG